MVKDAKVDIVLQRIEEDIGDELELIPSHIQRYGVNNIFNRAFSYLLGWRDNGKPIKLGATSAGALKTASIGAGLEHVETKTGISTSALSSAVVLTNIASRIEIVTEDYEMYLYTSVDNVTFEGAIRCLPNVRNVFDIATKAFKVKNADVNDVEYEFMGAR